MPIKTASDLWALLPLTGAGLIFALFGLGMWVWGWATGRTRGLEQADADLQRKLMDEQQKRLIAEGRLDAERRAGRQVSAALAALTAQAEPEQLRVAR